jgi:hypothetical protein
MPDITGSLRPPRLPTTGRPASPARGEMYYDTTDDTLYWWNGTTWISASGSGGSGGAASTVAYNDAGFGPGTALGVSTWKTLPGLAPGSPGTITPSGAFTENSDGSVTIRDAGWYVMQATMAAPAVAGRVDLSIGDAGPDTENFHAETFASSDRQPVVSCAGLGYFAAGSRIYVTARIGVAGTVTRRRFAIHKVTTGPAGIQGPKGDPGLTEYAIRTGGTGAYSVTTVASATSAFLPIAPAAAQFKSANADACYTINADGSITILQDGWYEIMSTVSVSGAIGAQVRIDSNVWFTSNDTTPAAGGPYTSLAQTTGDTGPSGRASQGVAQVAQLSAGYRIGVSAFNGDSVSRNLYSERFSISRVGAGPQGPIGATGPTGPTGTSGAPPLVSALPGSPNNGDEVYFQSAAMATAGLVWHLRYRSAGGTYKWECISGNPLYVRADTARNFSPGATYVAMPTDPQTLTVPLAGEYDVTAEAVVVHTVAGLTSTFYGYTVGPTAANDNWAVSVGFSSTGVAAIKTTRQTVVSPFTLIERVRTDSGGAATFSLRRLMAKPIRVG